MKYKLSALILLSALSICNTAKAQDFKYIPYIGLDYSYLDANAKSASPYYNSGSFNLGTKYNDYFGTELFYQQSADYKKHGSKSSYRAYGLDINAYLPLGCYNTVELFATAGAGEYVFKFHPQGTKSHNESAVGYRWGGGLIYNISENISVRAAVRYINLDLISDYDHMAEYSLGIRYYFL